MTRSPVIRSSAEGPAPVPTGEVFVRTSDGGEAKRVAFT